MKNDLTYSRNGTTGRGYTPDDLRAAYGREATDTELAGYETWEPSTDPRQAALEAFWENVVCFVAGFVLALLFVWAMP